MVQEGGDASAERVGCLSTLGVELPDPGDRRTSAGHQAVTLGAELANDPWQTCRRAVERFTDNQAPNPCRHAARVLRRDGTILWVITDPRRQTMPATAFGQSISSLGLRRTLVPASDLTPSNSPLSGCPFVVAASAKPTPPAQVLRFVVFATCDSNHKMAPGEAHRTHRLTGALETASTCPK